MPTADLTTAADQLFSAVVLHVEEHKCHVYADGAERAVEYAPQFPTPRVERVSPGNRLAIATAPDGRWVALWRWFDAVVVGVEGRSVRLWEPAHGKVLAEPRQPEHRFVPGTRAYLSAGLPGADWWVAGPVEDVNHAEVELEEVERLYTEHGLWEAALG